MRTRWWASAGPVTNPARTLHRARAPAPPLHDLHHLREPQAPPHHLRITSLTPASPTTCNRPEEPPWPLSPGFAKTQTQPPPGRRTTPSPRTRQRTGNIRSTRPSPTEDVHQRSPARGRHVRGRGGSAAHRGAGRRPHRQGDRLPDGGEPLHRGHRHPAPDHRLLEGRRPAALRQRRLLRRCRPDDRDRQGPGTRRDSRDLRRDHRREPPGLRPRPVLLQAGPLLPPSSPAP